ncbi:hypothetical protein Dsin_000163 [Dipteronia sinensis]|uniref:Regulatory factor Sgt1 n=1 Tax=Dipteronia sinensis TaxID=43782 RepID=A0AAE0DQI6_9ROSI|nr:hypothetical protein Dsin_000163 [Dipteronia sinensis]
MQPSEEDVAWLKSTFHPIPKPSLPDDSIEYSIYLVSSTLQGSNDSELRLQLREVQKYANEIQKQWLKGYIWQRESFALELKKEDGEVGAGQLQSRNVRLTVHAGLSYLRGCTEYGDSIEDEWVIVWVLRELTKKFNNIWIKVTDSDGEFLLIEASGTIPAWLEPEVAENRVWINDGQLKIIKPANSARSSKRTKEKLSLSDAQQVMLQEPKRIMHSTSIEEEAFYRLRNYPAQIKDNMHHALITIPRKAAFLLLQRPAYIASAIEAFYLRDPIALKPLQKQDNHAALQFAPKDFVTVSVKFPRVGYAQVKSQDFSPPSLWKKAMPSTSNVEAYTRASTGMKVTCGFEMLLSDPQYQDKQTVREMRMVLDDLDTGDEQLPSDQDLEKLEKRHDDEKWLDIDFDDLEHELGGKNKGEDDSRKREFGDKAAQENLQRIVKQFEDFLNDDSGRTGGDEILDDSSELEDGDNSDLEEDDEDDAGEDKDASFDEDEFTRMMQEMMGMPPDVMKEIMSGTIDALSEGQTGQGSKDVRDRAMSKIQEVDSSDEDIEDVKQMESELRASGALNLNSREQQRLSSHQIDERDDIGDSEDDQGLNDFDADFARNILQSFKSSGGMGGPAANLMSMMNQSALAESSRSQNKSHK